MIEGKKYEIFENLEDEKLKSILNFLTELFEELNMMIDRGVVIRNKNGVRMITSTMKCLPKENGMLVYCGFGGKMFEEMFYADVGLCVYHPGTIAEICDELGKMEYEMDGVVGKLSDLVPSDFMPVATNGL